MTQDEVGVTFKLPNRVIDFIDFLCTLKGQTREEVFRDMIRGELNLALDDPVSEWNQKFWGICFGGVCESILGAVSKQWVA